MRDPKKTFDIGDIFIPQGRVHILTERCKGCGHCVRNCPNDVLQLSKEHNDDGYHYPQVKNPEACINCGFCELICPEFAIWSLYHKDVNPTIGVNASVKSSEDSSDKTGRCGA